jgi:hypothetical protein
MLLENVREPSMRVLRVAALSASLVGMAAGVTPALAQMGGGGGNEGPHINMLADTPSKTPDEIERDRANEKAYKDSLKTIPDAKVSNDPWGGVRSNDAPKTVAPAKAAAKAKTKTGANAPN